MCLRNDFIFRISCGRAVFLLSVTPVVYFEEIASVIVFFFCLKFVIFKRNDYC